MKLSTIKKRFVTFLFNRPPVSIADSVEAVSAAPQIGCWSVTNKSVNRDAAASVANSYMHGVIVADGIGNNERVEEASLFVSEYVKEQINLWPAEQELLLGLIMEGCKNAFDKKFAKYRANDQFGTTYIVALTCQNKTGTTFKAAYAGNGAIWHIRGNFNWFSSKDLFPWTCMNYLNPHSILQDGKEVLTNCLARGTSNYSGPALLEFSEDPEYGDIIMICTDGISSNDQMDSTMDGFGEIWTRRDQKLRLFLDALSRYFAGNADSSNLDREMQAYLEQIKSLGLVEDDATIGVIISNKAQEYQNRCNNESDKDTGSTGN